MLDYSEKFDLQHAFDGCLKKFRDSDADIARVSTIQHDAEISMVVAVRGRRATRELLKAIERLMDRWDESKAKNA